MISKTELKDDDVTVFRIPRSGCRHCYGTGIAGFKTTGDLVVCRCVTNHLYDSFRKKADTNKYLTWGAYKDIVRKGKVRFSLKETDNETITNTVQEDTAENYIRRDEEETGSNHTEDRG